MPKKPSVRNVGSGFIPELVDDRPRKWQDLPARAAAVRRFVELRQKVKKANVVCGVTLWTSRF
jgi:hypothetical protein